MAVALILSSSVAANRIGGAVQAYALAALGIDPILVPTVQFGASPAKGGRGRATDPDHFAAMLEDVEAQGLLPDVSLVITGHFSHPDQVAAAAAFMARVAAANPKAILIVDPVLGDAPKGLYVKPEVAEQVVAQLLPRAHYITPNAWELGHITGRLIAGPRDALDALRQLSTWGLVTSVPSGDDRLGLVVVAPTREGSWLTHERYPTAPNGTGDLLTALFGAALMEGISAVGAAGRAAAAVCDLVQAAHEWGAPDLPVVALRDRLAAPHTHIRVERIA